MRPSLSAPRTHARFFLPPIVPADYNGFVHGLSPLGMGVTDAMRGQPGRLILCCVAFLGVAADRPPTRAERPRMFEPMAHVEPPADAGGWSANPIDCFIRAKQREHGLRPAAPADKRPSFAASPST